MTGNSIKKTLPGMARFMILILIILILPTNVALQLYIQHQNQKQNSEEIFWQLGTAYTEQYNMIWSGRKGTFLKNVFSQLKWLPTLWNIIRGILQIWSIRRSWLKSWM